MATVRIVSKRGQWSTTMDVPIWHGTSRDVARQLKELGMTGKILVGGVIEVDADKFPSDASTGKK
jgi:hypothetical protein